MISAKQYLEKINVICDINNEGENCNKDGCPLFKFGCGIPGNKNEINTVIKVVADYEAEKNKFICKKCGRNNKNLIEKEEIKFCPQCGTAITVESEQGNDR